MTSPDHLLNYCTTERQKELIQDYCLLGFSGTCDKHGISAGTLGNTLERVRFKAARGGYSPEHDMTHETAPGYAIKGTSTLYDPNGNVKLQWVKTKEDWQRQLEAFQEAVREVNAADAVPFVPIPDTLPSNEISEELLFGLPIGDGHMGMLSWAAETGADWDLDIADKVFRAAIARLACMIVPSPGDVGTMLIDVLGDFFHYDGMHAITPTNHNLLDSDTRYPKMLRYGYNLLHWTVRLGLSRCKRVKIIVTPGNHDPATSVGLREHLLSKYEDEPRVEVNESPMVCQYYQFGNNLIGSYHGDQIKMENLPLVMATDQAQAWGETEHRYWWTGHIHKSNAKVVASQFIDCPGCSVESFRILPPPDAWAVSKGYRPIRDMKGILFDAEFGEVERHTVNPQMIMKGK